MLRLKNELPSVASSVSSESGIENGINDEVKTRGVKRASERGRNLNRLGRLAACKLGAHAVRERAHSRDGYYLEEQSDVVRPRPCSR